MPWGIGALSGIVSVLYCFLIGAAMAYEGHIERLPALLYERPFLMIPLWYLLILIPMTLNNRRMPTWSSWVSLVVTLGLIASATSRSLP